MGHMNTKWGKITSSCKTPLLYKSNGFIGYQQQRYVKRTSLMDSWFLFKNFALIDEKLDMTKSIQFIIIIVIVFGYRYRYQYQYQYQYYFSLSL